MVAFWRESLRALERGRNAVVWAEKSADQRFPPAEYDVGIGRLGEASWGIMEEDRPKGIEFLRRAAANGWPPALYKFAKFTIAGEKLPPNLPLALEYLRKAADLGGPRSAYELAQLYAQGTGEPRSADDSPAALLRRSAATRYPPALLALAEDYRLGQGVPMDYIQAIRYYQAARDAAGVFNERLEDTEQACATADWDLQPRPDAPPEWKTFAVAVSTYLQASDRDPGATERLGEWYQAGTYVPVDPAAAYFWFDRAATLGVAGAAKKSEAIKATLQPEQLRPAARTNRPLRFQPSDLSY
jgi:TPR repeat protein